MKTLETAAALDKEAILTNADIRSRNRIAAAQGAVNELGAAYVDATKNEIAVALGISASGSDGASHDEAVERHIENNADAQKIVDQARVEGNEREKRIGTDNKKIANLESTVAANQHDHTRTINYDQKTLGRKTDASQQEGIKRHEETHRLQEADKPTTQSPAEIAQKHRREIEQTVRAQVGDAPELLVQEAIDQAGSNLSPDAERYLQIERLAYRENDSVQNGEGENGTSSKYREEYVKPSKEVSASITAHGGNGDQVIEDAARTNEGYEELRANIIANSVVDQVRGTREEVNTLYGSFAANQNSYSLSS